MLHNFERGGRAALVEAVKEMLADGADSDTELYLLRDEHGAIVAGNLPSLPDRDLRYRLPPSSSRSSTTAVLRARCCSPSLCPTAAR